MTTLANVRRFLERRSGRHTHDLEVDCGDDSDRVTVTGGEDCIWCKSTAEDRARVVFVSPSSTDLATIP